MLKKNLLCRNVFPHRNEIATMVFFVFEWLSNIYIGPDSLVSGVISVFLDSVL
jgi:hypothetical protein